MRLFKIIDFVDKNDVFNKFDTKLAHEFLTKVRIKSQQLHRFFLGDIQLITDEKFKKSTKLLK